MKPKRFSTACTEIGREEKEEIPLSMRIGALRCFEIFLFNPGNQSPASALRHCFFAVQGEATGRPPPKVRRGTKLPIVDRIALTHQIFVPRQRSRQLAAHGSRSFKISLRVREPRNLRATLRARGGSGIKCSATSPHAMLMPPGVKFVGEVNNSFVRHDLVKSSWRDRKWATQIPN